MPLWRPTVSAPLAVMWQTRGSGDSLPPGGLSAVLLITLLPLCSYEERLVGEIACRHARS